MAKAIQKPGVLTKRQEQIKDFISKFIAKNGYSPSFADIAKKMKIRVSAVSHHLNAIETKGHISRVPGLSRSLRVVEFD